MLIFGFSVQVQEGVRRGVRKLPPLRQTLLPGLRSLSSGHEKSAVLRSRLPENFVLRQVGRNHLQEVLQKDFKLSSQVSHGVLGTVWKLF